MLVVSKGNKMKLTKVAWIRLVTLITLFSLIATTGISETSSKTIDSFRVHDHLPLPEQLSSTDQVVFLKLLKAIADDASTNKKKWFYTNGRRASEDGKIWFYPNGSPVNVRDNWFYQDGRCAGVFFCC